MDNTEQDKPSGLRCSICQNNVDSESKTSIKWNQDVKKGYGVCSECIVKYRGHKKTTSRLEKDSYNYISTTIRQILNRHSFSLTERSDGSLRLNNYIIWNLRATSPNEYMVKVRLEIVKNAEKDYKYNWQIKLYNPDGEYINIAESDKPNVPYIKEFLGGFMKMIGNDPYEYFLSTLKQILIKNNIEVREKNESKEKSEYYIGFANGFNGKVVVDKEFTWEIQIYKNSGFIHSEYKGKSFALSPLREFFSKLMKSIIK
jgi:hypothetical protein